MPLELRRQEKQTVPSDVIGSGTAIGQLDDVSKMQEPNGQNETCVAKQTRVLPGGTRRRSVTAGWSLSHKVSEYLTGVRSDETDNEIEQKWKTIGRNNGIEDGIQSGAEYS